MTKMLSWNEFVSKLTTPELERIIEDYEIFKKDGYIGDSLLRITANEWCKNIDMPFNSTIMGDLASHAYSTRYYQMKNTLNLVFKELNSMKI